MDMYRVRWIAIPIVLFVALVAVGVTALANEGMVVDRSPSKEGVEQQARERGIEGPIVIPDRAPIDPNARIESHPPYLLVPEGWQGPVEPSRPVANRAPDAPPANSIEEASASPLWRTPRYIPPEYHLINAHSPQVSSFLELQYGDQGGNFALSVVIRLPQSRPIKVATWGQAEPGANVFVKSSIDGMPAVLWHGPDGGSGLGVTVRAYDQRSGEEYFVQGDRRLTVEQAIQIVKGLRK
jgi:hypothetical protein